MTTHYDIDIDEIPNFPAQQSFNNAQWPKTWLTVIKRKFTARMNASNRKNFELDSLVDFFNSLKQVKIAIFGN